MTKRNKKWLGFELKPTSGNLRIDWTSPIGPPAPESFVMIRYDLLGRTFEAFMIFHRSVCGGLKIESGSCSSERVARKKVELQLKTLHRVTSSAAGHLSKPVRRVLV